MKFLVDHIYILLTILFAVASQLIIKWQMRTHDLSQCQSMIEKFTYAFSMLFNPFIMLSILLTLLSGLSWMIAMTKFEISYAYPYTALGFVLILVFSALLFNEALGWEKIVGSLFIVVGIYITSRSL